LAVTGAHLLRLIPEDIDPFRMIDR
jgi:hypothetical protein